ncbi:MULTISPECIES: hypothetical protein [Burkholderia]|uniref:Phage tail protein n=1 Tax=Burkholderia glumae TaxID=337 RepID=A0ABY5B7Y7_BURGL|nr:hypothetical protein [Burkholderia glumae]MCR1769058.1 hypothetical protein [Burkholderia glumae]QKM47990.1 hypothetical protein B7760_02024 [Burkholderia glumae]USS42754.1 hypothetical protein NFI99_11275 [Burkholderia glumae]
MLTKDQILSAPDIKSVSVDVPEWGGGVTIVMLSGTARDALQERIAGNKSVSFFEAAIIVATAVDDSGAPLFGTEDIPALQAKSSAAISRVAGVAVKLNRMGPAGTEEAEKNSAAAPSGDSGTA